MDLKLLTTLENIRFKNSIIALTADVTTADLAKCKSVGMNDYIAKPVDERLLYNKNRVLSGNRRKI
jgi:CheY-like chemotaxis protein